MKRPNPTTLAVLIVALFVVGIYGGLVYGWLSGSWR
jgi:hypothetical protein